jgi:hypothetical protein
MLIVLFFECLEGFLKQVFRFIGRCIKAYALGYLYFIFWRVGMCENLPEWLERHRMRRALRPSVIG